MIEIENMSDMELDKAGEQLAEALGLRRSKEHKDRWQLNNGWGDKTNKGLMLTIKEMLRRIENSGNV